MKKCAIFLFIATLLFSCGKHKEEINYIEINGRSYPLRSAFYEDYGTTVWGVGSNKYRTYYIELQSEESVSMHPRSKLGFYLYSWDLAYIGDGTYYLGSEKPSSFEGAFVGANMRYDAKGYEIGGEFLDNLDPSYANRIEIHTAGKRNTKIFDVNLRFIEDGQKSYTVIAHYERGLVERPIVEVY